VAIDNQADARLGSMLSKNGPTVVSFALGERFSLFLAGRRGLIGEHDDRPDSL
jgi:hypothetical protein